MWLLSLASLVMGIYQGHEANQAQKSAARQYETQGATLLAENYREAARIEDDGKRFAASQKMMYIGSGVDIGGSAVVTLAQTDKWAKADAEAVRSRGRALNAYNRQAGRNARNMGRSQFIGGIVQGVGSAYSIYSSTKAPGTMGAKGANDPYVTGVNPPSSRQLARYR